MDKIKAKERRINAYFGKTIEDNELWEYLDQYPDDEKTHRLKYLARLGMTLVNQTVDSSVRIPPQKSKHQSSKKHKPKLPKDSSQNQTTPPDSSASFDSLNNIELVIKETIDPAKRMEKAQSRFITEEDDPEILELLKSKTLVDETKKSEDN